MDAHFALHCTLFEAQSYDKSASDALNSKRVALGCVSDGTNDVSVLCSANLSTHHVCDKDWYGRHEYYCKKDDMVNIEGAH